MQGRNLEKRTITIANNIAHIRAALGFRSAKRRRLWLPGWVTAILAAHMSARPMERANSLKRGWPMYKRGDTCVARDVAQALSESRTPRPIQLTQRCTVWRKVHRWMADPLGYRVPKSPPHSAP
jgi:hypothetical protein